MPKNDNGSWTVDDSEMFTDEEFKIIRKMIKDNKKEKAEKIIKDILERNQE